MAAPESAIVPLTAPAKSDGRARDDDTKAQFAAILREALDDVGHGQDEKTAAKLDEFMTPPIRSAADLLAVLDRQNTNFVDFRARRHKIFEVLDAALRPVEVLGEIASGAASEVFAPSEGIYAAVAFLISAAHGVSSYFDAIINLLGELQDFTTRLGIYAGQKMSPQLRAKIVQILAALFQVLLLAARAVRRGRLKAYFSNLFGGDSQVPDALKRLRQLTEGEERLVLAETHAVVEQSLSSQERLASMLSRVDINVQSMRAEARDKTVSVAKDQLKAILTPSVYPEDSFLAFSRSRAEGTCEWILGDTAFRDWAAGNVQFLWICGNPGTGKSYVSSRLVSRENELASRGGPDATPRSFGYFFFRDNNAETRSVLQGLKDVSYQIAHGDAAYAQQLVTRLRSADDIKTIASAFRRLLVEPLIADGQGRRMVMLLDGIDEAEPGEMTELLGLIGGLREDRKAWQLQVVLVGRTHLADQVSAALDKDDQLRTIQIDRDRNGDDVRSFIVQGVNHARILRGSSAELKNEIINAMTQQVNGLFILAQFMLSDLNRKRHPRRILESLRTYPKEINGMLLHTLSGLSGAISEEEAGDLNEILSWVTCAERPLTLAQLAFALTIKFGDPPLRLEESLRGQYSCFFTLEREDGLSTADLLDRHEQRGPAAPMGKEAAHAHSPASRSDIGDLASNELTTTVTFFHASVGEFFKQVQSPRSPLSPTPSRTIGFDLGEARASIAETCLTMFTDPPALYGPENEQSAKALSSYAGLYWQEQVGQIDPKTVPAAEKQQLGRLVHKMLTEQDVILRWVASYDDSLEIFTDANIQHLVKLMTDPEVIAGLDPDAQAWAQRVAANANGFGLVEQVGRVYVDAWLLKPFQTYLPTLYCFGIVHTVACMADGLSWSDAEAQWRDAPAETRVQHAIRWSDKPVTAHWHRRVGSTFLTLHNYEDALRHYSEALRLDPEVVETGGRVGYCLAQKGDYQGALDHFLECEKLDEEALKGGRLDGGAEKAAKWRTYMNQYQSAIAYYQLGRVEESLLSFKRAIRNPDNPYPFQPELAYLEALKLGGRFGEMMQLIDEMDAASHPDEDSRFLALLMNSASWTAVMDWIPRAAINTGRISWMLSRYESAIQAAERAHDPAKALIFIFVVGQLHFRVGEDDEAVAIDETVCYVTSRPRVSLDIRILYTLMFRRLASLYHFKTLLSGPGTAGWEAWTGKLATLRDRQRQLQAVEMPIPFHGLNAIDASFYLGLFRRLQDRHEEARALFAEIIADSLGVLSDDDPFNDQFALINILRVLLAAGDGKNAMALARSLRRPPSARTVAPKFVTQSRPQVVHEARKPTLPTVLSANWDCRQCCAGLDGEGDIRWCFTCIAAHCAACVDDMARRKLKMGAVADFASVSRRVLCDCDHEWLNVPPLDRDLAPGEILLESGEVTALGQWCDDLRKAWIAA